MDIKCATLYNSHVRVRVRAQEKRDCSNGNLRDFPAHIQPSKNASAFDIKRKCVSLQTQVRFTLT